MFDNCLDIQCTDGQPQLCRHKRWTSAKRSVQVWNHRRRIKTEEKATVVPSVWGLEYIQCLVLAVLHYSRTILSNGMNCIKEKNEFILFFHIVLGKIDSVARIWINSSPQTEATTFAFSFVFIFLLLVCREFTIIVSIVIFGDCWFPELLGTRHNCGDNLKSHYGHAQCCLSHES